MNIWFYEADGKAVGPIAEGELAILLRDQRLPASALVWTEEFGAMRRTADVNAARLTHTVATTPTPIKQACPDVHTPQQR